MTLTENKLRNIIRESIINIINEEVNSNGLNKYHIFYIDNGNVYDGIYNTTYEVKNDKQAFKKFYDEFSKVFLANLDGDLEKTERYAIGKVTGEDEYGEEDYDIIYDITFYTKNGKKADCKYYYTADGNFKFGDTRSERNEKKFHGYLSDYIGRNICDIPDGYCGSLAMIKKFVYSFILKQMKTNPDNTSVYVNINKIDRDNWENSNWKRYHAGVFNFGGEFEFYFTENND